MDPRRRRVDRHRHRPDMKTPPARLARWTRGHTRSASFPASRDRYAGLTGPAIKDSRRVPPGVRGMARRRAPEVRSGVLEGSRAARRTVGDGTFGPAIRCQRAPTVAKPTQWRLSASTSAERHLGRDVGSCSRPLAAEAQHTGCRTRTHSSTEGAATRRAGRCSPSRSRSECRPRWWPAPMPHEQPARPGRAVDGGSVLDRVHVHPADPEPHPRHAVQRRPDRPSP